MKPKRNLWTVSCPIPNAEAIKSLEEDVIPDPILQYLIDIDMYCEMIAAIEEH